MYYLPVDHIRNGTCVVALPGAKKTVKNAINATSFPRLVLLDPAIFVQSFRKVGLTWLRPADSHVLRAKERASCFFFFFSIQPTQPILLAKTTVCNLVKFFFLILPVLNASECCTFPSRPAAKTCLTVVAKPFLSHRFMMVYRGHYI